MKFKFEYFTPCTGNYLKFRNFAFFPCNPSTFESLVISQFLHNFFFLHSLHSDPLVVRRVSARCTPVRHSYSSFRFHLALLPPPLLLSRSRSNLLRVFSPSFSAAFFPGRDTIIPFAIRLAACSDSGGRATLHPVDCIPLGLPRTNASFDGRDSKKELPYFEKAFFFSCRTRRISLDRDVF